MRTARFLLVAAVLAVAVRPELTRYRGERQLAYLEAVTQMLRQRGAAVVPNDPRLASILSAADAVVSYPGDWRPLMVSATLHSVAGDRRAAVERVASAMRLGERPELDVNLASFYADHPSADALRTRAVWLSPALAAHLPEPARARVMLRIQQLDARLRAGELTERDFPPLAIH